jgi:hypothetical protein
MLLILPACTGVTLNREYDWSTANSACVAPIPYPEAAVGILTEGKLMAALRDQGWSTERAATSRPDDKPVVQEVVLIDPRTHAQATYYLTQRARTVIYPEIIAITLDGPGWDEAPDTASPVPGVDNQHRYNNSPAGWQNTGQSKTVQLRLRIVDATTGELVFDGITTERDTHLGKAVTDAWSDLVEELPYYGS